MQVKKSQLIGYIILGILFAAFLYTLRTEQATYREREAPKRDTLSAPMDNASAKNKSTTEKTDMPGNSFTMLPVLRYDTLQTPLFQAVLSNKGGSIHSFSLKKYNNTSGKKQWVQLISPEEWAFSYMLRSLDGQLQSSGDLFFNTPQILRTGDSISVIYTAKDTKGHSIRHSYVFHNENYGVDFSIDFPDGSDAFVDKNTLNIHWKNTLRQQEKNIEYERTKTEIATQDNRGDFTTYSLGSGVEEKPKGAHHWVSLRQHFFNTTLIAHTTPMEDLSIKARAGTDTATLIMQSNISFLSPLYHNAAHYTWFIAPNDYEILQETGWGLERLVDLGQGMAAFAKYINKAIIMPVFNLLSHFIPNYGVVILFLTIIIRLITAPLLYSSYKSAAKMKILQPEVEALKKKYGNDESTLNLKRMELYRNAGANPLQGCLPALLQIPIFLALFYFFSSNIALREQSFLWADDLSSYDSIAHLGFRIPFYGSHVSLFTLLYVMTSFATAFLNRSSAMDQSNPMLQYMPYILPVIFLGFFNSLPAALTWYYTVSNTITVLLQLIIQKYIINHDKLIQQIEANKKRPRKKSLWLQKAEEMQAQRQQQSKQFRK